MLFNYKAISKNGEQKEGSIEASNEDVAISSLQRRGLVVVSIASGEKTALFEKNISFFERVSSKEIVLLSRQISTLFEAHVPALKVFKLLANEAENPLLGKKLGEVSEDIQGGMTISEAFRKHPKVFSDFYVNMVAAGEESGKLNETFGYLADNLEQSYDLTAKIKNALIYPAFVISIFLLVMIGMFTFIIPRIAGILTASGQELPIYTKIVIGISDLLVNYGLFAFIGAIILGFFFNRLRLQQADLISKIALSIPVFGNLFEKLYLARITGNMYTMITSGISMVRALEITSTVVGDETYKAALLDVAEQVKAGKPISDAFASHEIMPSMLIQMIRVGEETGELGDLFQKVSVFYKKEVDGAVDTLISLIEPTMIVLLGLGVGTVLAAVLLPIYSITGA